MKEAGAKPPAPMDTVIKAQWLKALRSGDYVQGKNHLHNHLTNTYCCLGVLCDLAVKAKVLPPPSITITNVHEYGADKESAILPAEVMKWAGLKSQYGYSSYDPKEGDVLIPVTLPHMNDIGQPFAKIADFIEEHL